ncbi:hypothetical protein Tco_0793930 [Tanacetum coccineum]
MVCRYKSEAGKALEMENGEEEKKVVEDPGMMVDPQIEAVWIFLLCLFKDFVVYQDGVKSAFFMCKKQTVVANSTTDAEYVAASSCYGQLETYFSLKKQSTLRLGITLSEIPMIEANSILVKYLLTRMLQICLQKHLILERILELKLSDSKLMPLSIKLNAVDYKLSRWDEECCYEAFVRRDLHLEMLGCDCLPNATIFEQLTLMGAKTTAWNEFSSTMASAIVCLANNQKSNVSKYIFESMMKNLDSAVKFLTYPRFMQVFLDSQLEGMINHNRIYIAPSHTKKVFANMEMQRKDFSGRVTPLFSTMMAVNEENVSKHSNDPLISGEDRLKLEELMILWSRSLRRNKGQELMGLEDYTRHHLENVHDADMFGVHDLDGDEVFVETKELVVNVATTTSTIPVRAAKDLSNVDMTLAQALAELKSAKPKAVTNVATITKTDITSPKSKGLVIQEHEQASTPITSSKDKGKGIMVEEPLKIKKKDQDKVETDYELAQRLEAEEQEELTIKEKSKLFQQLLEKRIKFFAAKRAEEKRNKPPTKAQQRSIMCTYLKNMAGWKPKDLKTKSFANVQELFDKAMKRVNTFVDMDTKLVGGSDVREGGSETREESSSKRAGDELEQEPSKRQKMEDDKEIAELQSMMEVIPDEEEVVVDAIPLATKPPSIVDWKIIKEGKISYYQIIRANGNSKRYSSMIKMLKSLDREDLETLWKLVKAKHGYTRPEE